MPLPRSASKSATGDALRVIAALTLAFSARAAAQSSVGSLGDPKKCVAVLDEMGDVGFRISDAQIVAEAIVSNLRKRVGFNGVAYAGIAQSASSLKTMLATPEGAGPQDAQLKWFKECEDAASWRLRARFGVTKGTQWVTASCRKKGADPKDVIEEKRFEGKTFLEARDKLAAAMPSFCPAIAGAVPGIVGPGDIPTEHPDAGPPGMHKKEAPKPWTPPPRRDG